MITAAAKSDDGIVKVHRVGETVYYEIPKAQLGKDFLWNTQIKKTTIGAGYGGQAAGSRVVRWVTKGDRVLLLSIDYSLVADPTYPPEAKKHFRVPDPNAEPAKPRLLDPSILIRPKGPPKESEDEP